MVSSLQLNELRDSFLEKLAGVSSVAKWTGVSLPETAVESPGWWWGTPLIETPEATPILVEADGMVAAEG